MIPTVERNSFEIMRISKTKIDIKVIVPHLAILTFTVCSAQEPEKKTYKNESPPSKEIYYVLKVNPEIKHREYKKSYMKFSVKGQFDNGEKVGVWEFRGYDGKMGQKIDFTNNEVTKR